MADDTLRALARRFRETGALEDEAAWLQERLRVGDLTPARLELAAYLGHEAARVSGGRARPPELEALIAAQQERIGDRVRAEKLARRRYPQAWLRAAGLLPRAALVRIGLAAARLLAGRLEAEDALLTETLSTVEAWLADPEDEDARERCVPAGDAAIQARGGLIGSRDLTWYAFSVAGSTAYAAGSILRHTAEESVGTALAHATAALDDPGPGIAAEVLAAVRAEVVPWALEP